jgi:hypothetical protein
MYDANGIADDSIEDGIFLNRHEMEPANVSPSRVPLRELREGIARFANSKFVGEGHRLTFRSIENFPAKALLVVLDSWREFQAGTSQSYLLVELLRRDALAALELRISFGHGALNFYDLRTGEIGDNLLTEPRTEKIAILPRKLIGHGQDFLHAHGRIMALSQR